MRKILFEFFRDFYFYFKPTNGQRVEEEEVGILGGVARQVLLEKRKLGRWFLKMEIFY